MAAMPASWFLLVFVLLGQGGNHLLDYASTGVYWQMQKMEPTVENLSAILKTGDEAELLPVLVKLASPDPRIRAAAADKLRAAGDRAVLVLVRGSQLADPEVSATCRTLLKEIRKNGQVRRLMAIRTLGELMNPEALPVLRPLAESKDPFVAEYARRAIARIEGKPAFRPGEDLADRRFDVDVLPPDCRAVIQQTFGGSTTPVEDLLKKIGPLLGRDPATAAQELTKQVLEIAEKTGDIRLDSVTVGVAGEVGQQAGWVSVVIRGEWDIAAVKSWIGAVSPKGLQWEKIQGVDVISPEKNVVAAFVDSRRVLFCAGANRETLPVEGLLKAIASRKGRLLAEKEMKPLLDRIDMSQALWGMMKVTESYRQAPVLAAFDEVILSTGSEGGLLHLRVGGAGSDAEQVAAAVKMINEGVQSALGEIQRMGVKAIMIPGVGQARQFLESVKCKAEGKTDPQPRHGGSTGLGVHPWHAAHGGDSQSGLVLNWNCA